MVFLKKKSFPPKIFFFTFFLCNFSVHRYGVFKKIKKKIFDPEKVKKRASKVAHNWPRPFYYTDQPRPQPTAQNWLSISWDLGTRHLFSYPWYSSTFKYLTIFILPILFRLESNTQTFKIRTKHHYQILKSWNLWFGVEQSCVILLPSK